jgi:hypothetical protein
VRRGCTPAPARSAVVSALALVAAGLAACGGGGGGGDGAAAGALPEKTAWPQVLDGIADDGTVPKETALQAFSLAVAPIPGVEVPAGPPGPIFSGSGAIRWTLRYLDELPPDQQQVVRRFLDAYAPSAGAPGGPGARAAPTAGDGPGAEPYRQIVNELLPQIAAELGYGLSAEVNIFVPSENECQQQYGQKCAEMWAGASPYNSVGEQTGGMAACHIVISPNGQKALDLAGKGVRSVLAHELMHCFNYELLGIDASKLTPPWLSEGSATWAGEYLAGGSSVSATFWSEYLVMPKKTLFGRDYDAIGFYAHLDESGIDPWSVISPMLQAGTNASAFGIAVGPAGEELLNTWPTGYARDLSLGPAWDTTGPGITDVKPTAIVTTVGNGAPWKDDVLAGANSLTTVGLTADVVRVETTGVYGRVRFADGSEERPTDLVGRNLCTRSDGCECPAGTSGGGTAFERVAGGNARVAFSGGVDPGSLTITGIGLEEFCEETPPEQAKSAPAGLDKCLVGTWVSTAIKPAVGGGFAGAAEVTYEGGAGAVLTVKKGGAASIDFEPMDLVEGTLVANGETLGTTQLGFTGQVTGTMSTSGNEVFSLGIASNTWAYEGIAETDFGAFPFSGDVTPQAAVGSFEATYTCSRTTFDFTFVGEGVSGGSTWQRT